MVKKISGCGLCLIIRYSLSEDTVSLSPSLDFLLDNYMNALRGFPSGFFSGPPFSKCDIGGADSPVI